MMQIAGCIRKRETREMGRESGPDPDRVQRTQAARDDGGRVDLVEEDVMY